MPRKKSAEEAKIEEKKESRGSDTEKKVLELARTGMPSEKIGLELKKQGIYVKQSSGKRISEILKSAGMKKNSEITNLESKVGQLNKHISSNKKDFPTKRALLKRAANLNKLKKSE